MKSFKDDDYKRQLIIANSLYEMGIDCDVIKMVTTVKKDEILNYRKNNHQNKKNQDKSIDIINKTKYN